MLVLVTVLGVLGIAAIFGIGVIDAQLSGTTRLVAFGTVLGSWILVSIAAAYVVINFDLD